MAAAKWKVGFSQCTTLEPWRVQFNKDIEAEAKNHPEVELIITDGQDKTEKQVADCENLIVQQVNVLLVSPKEFGGADRRGGKGDRRQDPRHRARPQRRHEADHQVHRRRQCADRPGGGRIRRKLLGGPGKASRRHSRLGRHGNAARAPSSRRVPFLHGQGTGDQNLLNNQSGDWKQDQPTTS